MLRAVLCHPLHQISLETWLHWGSGMLLPCFVLVGFSAVVIGLRLQTNSFFQKSPLWWTLIFGCWNACKLEMESRFHVFLCVYLWIYYTKTLQCGCHVSPRKLVFFGYLTVQLKRGNLSLTFHCCFFLHILNAQGKIPKFRFRFVLDNYVASLFCNCPARVGKFFCDRIIENDSF